MAAQSQHIIMQHSRAKMSVRSVCHTAHVLVVQTASAHLHRQVLKHSMQLLQGTTMQQLQQPQQHLQEPQQMQELLLLLLELGQGESAASTFASQCSGTALRLPHVLLCTCCLSRQERMHGWMTLAPSAAPSLLSVPAASCPLMRRCGATSGRL